MIKTEGIDPMGGMFVRNLAAFTDALGVQNAPSVVYMSLVPWPDDTARDQFINALTGINMRDRLSYGS